MKEVTIFFLVASIIYLIKELYLFVRHVIYVQRFPMIEKDGFYMPNKYEISIWRQFGILFTISYIITYIIV